MFRQAFIAAFVIVGTAGSALSQSSTNCDLALRKIRQGEPISDADRLTCRRDLSDYYDDLCRKHGLKNNDAFPEPDRTLFYTTAIKTAIIDPEENGGWAFRSTLRFRVLDQLRTMISTSNDPFLAFCAVFPALDRNDTTYAVKCFEILKERDAFLADLAVKWSFQWFRNPKWLLTHYLTSGQQDKAKEVADMAATTGLATGMEAKAHLLDELGEYTRAEACCREIEQRHHYVGALVWFYRRHSAQKGEAGTAYQQRYDDLTTLCFPKGLCKVKLAGSNRPPTHGVSFTDENDTTRRYGLRTGMVICAVDGYQVENLTQYYFVRELDSANPRMDLIAWDGKDYLEVTVTISNRRFGVDLKSYEQAINMGEPNTPSHGTALPRRP